MFVCCMIIHVCVYIYIYIMFEGGLGHRALRHADAAQLLARRVLTYVDYTYNILHL